jgi:DNA-binding transcriptional ArsR family regulator
MERAMQAFSMVSRERAEAASEFMRLLTHPNRLMIACILIDGERSVSELEAALGIRQPALSQQLAQLREAGIVKARREVKQVFYRLADPRAAELLATLHRLFCANASAPLSLAATGVTPAAATRESPTVTSVPSRRRSPEAASFARIAPPSRPRP